MELIAFTNDLLARHGVVHWLDYGSLLGAVREGELIPWDADADFGVLQREQPAVLALADEVAAAGHRLNASHRGVVEIFYSHANRTRVDIFVWKARDGLVLPMQNIDYAWPGMASRLAFPERFIMPLGEVSLHGLKFPAPRPADEFLRDHRYGPGYATPTRPIRTVKLYPHFDVEETTPEIEQLLARIATDDERLAQLRSRWRWSHHRAGELWVKGGLPQRPSKRSISAVLAEGSSDCPTATIEGLARSVALLEQAIDEQEHWSARLAIRRGGRRLRCLAEVLAANLRHRPHRAGFPFGVESAEYFTSG